MYVLPNILPLFLCFSTFLLICLFPHLHHTVLISEREKNPFFPPKIFLTNLKHLFTFSKELYNLKILYYLFRWYFIPLVLFLYVIYSFSNMYLSFVCFIFQSPVYGNSHESVQSRRVVISHNMDKALKEGKN